MSSEKEFNLVFKVHTNFKNRGLLFGVLKIRNLIDILLIPAPIAVLVYFFIPNIKIMAIIQLLLIFPLLIICFIGVNGHSFTEFLKLYFIFYKKKPYNLMRFKRIERKKLERKSKSLNKKKTKTKKEKKSKRKLFGKKKASDELDG